MDMQMKLLLAVVLPLLLADAVPSIGSAESSTGRASSSSNRPATFACSDSLPRADGTQSTGTPCNIARQYCYEASGGAPVSHGAQCRALPRPGATCADLVAGLAGAVCTGTTVTGMRVQFAFP